MNYATFYAAFDETECATEFIEILEREGCIMNPAQCRKLAKDIWKNAPDKIAISAATSLLAPGVVHESMHAAIFNLLHFYFGDFVSSAAVTKIFRLVWSRYGFFTVDEESINVMKGTVMNLRKKAPAILMTHKERKLLTELPSKISIYRGEPVWTDIDAGVTGMSWTLSRDVANYYTHANGHDNGWLISGTVMTQDILAIFLDREEKEIIVDPRRVCITNVDQGTANHFPQKYW